MTTLKKLPLATIAAATLLVTACNCCNDEKKVEGKPTDAAPTANTAPTTPAADTAAK